MKHDARVFEITSPTKEIIVSMSFFFKPNRHLKIDVYRGPQTSTGHVTRLQPRVYGKFSTFSTARGRFSRKSFTSTFICMNVL